MTRSVGEEQAALQAAPPTLERPSGAPRTLDGPPQAGAAHDWQQARLERAEAEGADQQERAWAEQVRSEQPAAQVPRPHLAGDAQGRVTAGDVENVQQAVRNVPTTDPAMNTTVAAPPKVDLSGEADPARTDEQKARLAEQSRQMHTDGRAESAVPLGEDQVFPAVPPETLAAQVPAPGGDGAAPGAGGAVPEQGVAVVAQQERGPQVQAAVGQGQGRMGAGRQQHEQAAAQENARHESEVAQAVAANSEQQAAERGKVATDAAAQREQWRAEQDRKVGENNEQAATEHTKARGEVDRKKTDTDQANERKEAEENGRIQREREEAERKAAEEKRRKEREAEGGGFFSWLASKVTSFFNDLLDAVTGFFNAAIEAINGIVRAFTELVVAAIEAARTAIVGLINALATALIALCDVLAVFFPELAARIRKGIEDLRDAAIAAVNTLAEALKTGVKALLDLLARALTGLLRLLETALKAAVEVVRTAVNAAIEFAKAAIQLLGEFAAIIADIAADGVGTWLGKLGGGARDGVQNHLWGAIQTGVREWFNGKVEEVLGLGKAVLDILVRGCLSMGKIAKMAWDGIIAALPTIIIQVVLERLVALIIPAAGAVLAVVQGLMAAWGTISRILAAIGAFITFLKAVRSGPAAALFAKAVAAGVVALLEFVTNFLMTKLKGAAKGVGTTLKGIAARIGRVLGRAARGTRRAAGNAVNSARRGLRSASQALRPPRRAPAPATRRRPGTVAGARGRPAATRGRPPARRPVPATRRPSMMDRARGAVRTGLNRVRGAARALGARLRDSRVGRALANSARKLRERFNRLRSRWRERQRARQERRRQRERERNSPQAKQRRLELIVARIRPRIESLLRRGVRGAVLRALLGALRRWYRLTALRLDGALAFTIRAFLNPEAPVVLGTTIEIAGVRVEVDRLLRAIRVMGDEARAAGVGSGRVTEGYVQTASSGRRQALKGQVGARSVDMLAAHQARRRQPKLKWDVVSSVFSEGQPAIETLRKPGFGGLTPRGRRRPPKPQNRLITRPGEKSVPASPSYDEMVGEVNATGRPQEIAQRTLRAVQGNAEPPGPDDQLVGDLTRWVVEQEAQRNIGALPTHVMALDLAARGEVPFNQAAAMMPMHPSGAQEEANQLRDYLRGDGAARVGAQRLAEREITVIRAWVESLKDLKLKDAATAEAKERELILEIRRRIQDILGVKPEEVGSGQEFWARVTGHDVPE
ncbi:hypothetical protein [Crossiella equi]|uniref:hypothetical protein n=1 Tax=Crossiella equi TaxID=130796 RepID=UPI000A3AA1C1|nr:hypothetical protein [Crossiella equi]